MDTLVAETWYCIERYEQIQSEIEPMSMYELIVESISDPVVKAKEEENAKKEKSSGNFISRFFSNILKLITNLIQAISNFVNLTFMKPEERKRYEQMKAIRDNDPRFKGKTLTVYDFRKLEKEYNDMENKINKRINDIKTGATDTVNDVVGEVKDLVNKNIKGFISVVAPSLAMKLASSNIEQAKEINNVLKNDKTILQQLEAEIGKHEAKKFKNQINHSANRDTSLLSKAYMSLYELRHGKARCLEDCWVQTYDQFSKIMGWKGTPLQRAIAVAQNGDIIKRASKNEAIRNTATTAIKGYIKGKKRAKEEHIKTNRMQKLGGDERETNTGLYATKRDWVTGRSKESN